MSLWGISSLLKPLWVDAPGEDSAQTVQPLPEFSAENRPVQSWRWRSSTPFCIQKEASDFGHEKSANSSTGIPIFQRLRFSGFAYPKKKMGSIQYIIPESDILLPSIFFPNGFFGIIFSPNPLFFKFAHFLFNLHKHLGHSSHFRIKHLLEKCENLRSPSFKTSPGSLRIRPGMSNWKGILNLFHPILGPRDWNPQSWVFGFLRPFLIPFK